MIKELKFVNWKSFEDAHLWIDPLTFVIGTNSTGKSNIIDALAFLSYAAQGKRLSDFGDKEIRGGIDGLIRRGQQTSTLSITLPIGKDEYTYDISVEQNGKELLVCDEKLVFRSSSGRETTLYLTDSASGTGTQIVARFPKDRPGPRKGINVRRDISILSQIQGLTVLKNIKEGASSVISVLTSIFILDPKPEQMRSYTPLSDTIASDGSNIAGVIAGLPTNKKQEFEKSLTNYVRRLPERDLKSIWAQTVGLFNSDAMLYCSEEWVDGTIMDFDARSMSDGTLRFIAIVSALLTIPEGSTLIIEEVDNGLHPSRAGELVSALKEIGHNRELDIVCTTHDPVLIDALGPEMLPFISCVTRSLQTGASQIQLLQDVPGLLKLLANYTPGGMMTNGLLKSTEE